MTSAIAWVHCVRKVRGCVILALVDLSFVGGVGWIMAFRFRSVTRHLEGGRVNKFSGLGRGIIELPILSKHFEHTNEVDPPIPFR